MGCARARPAERTHHAGGLPTQGVGGRVQLRRRAGVGTWMAHSGRYPAETVFFLRSLSAIDICISDLHSGGVSKDYDMCFLQQSDPSMFAILQIQSRSTQ